MATSCLWPGPAHHEVMGIVVWSCYLIAAVQSHHPDKTGQEDTTTSHFLLNLRRTMSPCEDKYWIPSHLYRQRSIKKIIHFQLLVINEAVDNGLSDSGSTSYSLGASKLVAFGQLIDQKCSDKPIAFGELVIRLCVLSEQLLWIGILRHSSLLKL